MTKNELQQKTKMGYEFVYSLIVDTPDMSDAMRELGLISLFMIDASERAETQSRLVDVLRESLMAAYTLGYKHGRNE